MGVFKQTKLFFYKIILLQLTNTKYILIFL